MSELEPQSASTFFQEALDGRHCQTNWFEGNPGALGSPNEINHFSAHEAPALIGFQDTSDSFCASELGGWEHAQGLEHAARCAKANLNLISLSGEQHSH
jgi:hypothetical protein